ncbi:MAG: GIY-YIG nuclease family protein [Methanobacteriaceae archaeon]
MTTNPPLTGIYCLVIYLKEKSPIPIGKKGEFLFDRGCYVYVGSALNSLPTRIARHLRQEKRLHWHIDYFLESVNSEIVDVIFTLTHNPLECQVANEISKKGTGIPRFGSSDCQCPSHLFYFKDCKESVEACKKAFEVLGQDHENLEYLKI